MNQLEKTYANFIESVCKMYNVPDAAAPLVKGYEALLEAQNSVLMEGFGLDSIKRAGQNVIDFTKGFIHGVLPGAACIVLPWIPIEAVNYGKKLYEQHKIDEEYAVKLGELNKELDAMNKVSIKVPKNIVNLTDGVSGFSSTKNVLHELTVLANNISPTDIDCKDTLCDAANSVKWAQHNLSNDAIASLKDVATCIANTDKDERYECKREALSSLDDAIYTIRRDNRILYNALVSFSNSLADACQTASSDIFPNKENCNTVDIQLDSHKGNLEEWRKDQKAKCDTISYGPGHFNRWSKCRDDLWK